VTAQPVQFKLASREEARQFVTANGIDTIKVGVTDVDGILRGKYLSRDKFLSALEGGFGFCDVIVGWDSNDQLYDNVTYTGWHTAYPDAPVRVLPDTCRDIPFEPDTVLFLGEFSDKAEPVCPRGTLRRVVKRAADLGFSVLAAAEYEFFVFDETPHSVRAKNYKNLTTMTPGFFGYSMLRNSVHAGFYKTLLDTMRAMDVTLEGLHTETGAGVLEAAIGVDGILAAADKATRRRCSRPTRRSSPSAKARWRASWRSGRTTGRARAATCTSRSRTRRARRSSTTRRRRTASRTRCATSSAASRC